MGELVFIFYWQQESEERKEGECLVLIDIDRDCNECGEGTAP